MKIDILYNPFKYIAGGRSFVYGFLILIISAGLGSFNNLHFDGVIDIHIGGKAPWWFFYFEAVFSWLVFSLLLYSSSLFLSKSKVRMIDIFGTQVLAKAPLIFISLISFLTVFHFNYGGLPKIDVWFVAFGLITVVFTIWVIALMYNAYVVSANMKGAKAVISFIAALIVSEIIVKYSLIKFYKLL